jgi:hypothetical protein
VSTSPNVCSGLGSCVATNKCQCDSPSIGDYCEHKEYHWAPGSGSGSWSDIQNWGVNRNGINILAQSIPSSGDKIYFDLPGTYTVIIDVPLVSIISVYAGSSTSFPTLQIMPVVSLSVVESFYCHSNWVINANGTNLNFGNLTLFGTLNYYGDNSLALQLCCRTSISFWCPIQECKICL